MSEPEEIKKLREQVQKADRDVQKRREYLQLDSVFTFKSKTKQFSDRPLRFRKLRFSEIAQIQGLMPKEVEEGQDFSVQDSAKTHEAACTALAAATRDDFSIQDFRDLEPTFVFDAFKWLIDLSGFSEAAVADLGWFRREN